MDIPHFRTGAFLACTAVFYTSAREALFGMILYPNENLHSRPLLVHSNSSRTCEDDHDQHFPPEAHCKVRRDHHATHPIRPIHSQTASEGASTEGTPDIMEPCPHELLQSFCSEHLVASQDGSSTLLHASFPMLWPESCVNGQCCPHILQMFVSWPNAAGPLALTKSGRPCAPPPQHA